MQVGMMADMAMALVDVILANQFDRIRTCVVGTCTRVLIDLSKNRSRRFCSTGCANRTNVSAYRARQAAQVTRKGAALSR
jgi:predicted RNA-binding Zn ribbon-like protein